MQHIETKVDWIESNGDCGGASTLHTIEGPGSQGCTAWGCRADYMYNGKASFHMRLEYGQDGSWTTIRDGETISPTDLSPQPDGSAWSVIRDFYSSKGAVIYSSQWVGWVPVDACGTDEGDLPSSSFTISNLVIEGELVQGPSATLCADSARYKH